MPNSAGAPQALLRSTDNVVAAFRTFLAEEQVSARTARVYLGHLGRFAAWLREQYRADLVDATSHDLREYRTQLAARQKPSSVNAALAALQRFYGWARETGRLKTDPSAKLKPVASQPLAPQGFTAIERQRIRREAERAGPMVDAIVTTLLNTGLRVDELVSLTWSDVTMQARSGRASIRSGKGGKARVVPLNAAVREALRGICPAAAHGPVFRGKRGPYTDRGIRNLLAVLGRRADVAHVHRIVSATTRHGNSSRPWTSRPQPLSWAIVGWTPYAFMPSRMQLLCSVPPSPSTGAESGVVVCQADRGGGGASR